MFGFGSKTQEIKNQKEFEDSISSYLDTDSRKIVKLLMPSFNEEIYIRTLELLSESEAMALINDLPKDKIVPLINQITSMIPYNEETAAKIIGEVLLLIVLRSTLYVEQHGEDVSLGDDFFIAIFEDIIKEMELIHKYAFDK